MLIRSGESRQAEALAAFDAALRFVSGSIEVRNNRVNTLLALGRVDEAWREIEAILPLAPQMAELNDTKGMVLEALGRRAEAVASYREALRLKPELLDAQRHLAEVTRGIKETAH